MIYLRRNKEQEITARNVYHLTVALVILEVPNFLLNQLQLHSVVMFLLQIKAA